jgi:hypothetical protein
VGWECSIKIAFPVEDIEKLSLGEFGIVGWEFRIIPFSKDEMCFLFIGIEFKEFPWA